MQGQVVLSSRCRTCFEWSLSNIHVMNVHKLVLHGRLGHSRNDVALRFSTKSFVRGAFQVNSRVPIRRGLR